MQSTDPDRHKDGDFRLVEGLLFGALLSIPLWVWIGVTAAAIVQEGPISGLQVAILFIAVAVELILLQFWPAGLPWVRRLPTASPQAGARAILERRSMKPMLFLLGLAGTYLHYYLWDVQLQIASMSSITVFVHAPALG